MRGVFRHERKPQSSTPLVAAFTNPKQKEKEMRTVDQEAAQDVRRRARRRRKEPGPALIDFISEPVSRSHSLMWLSRELEAATGQRKPTRGERTSFPVNTGRDKREREEREGISYWCPRDSRRQTPPPAGGPRT